MVRAHLESCNPGLEPSAQERHGPVGAGPETKKWSEGWNSSPMRKG